MEFRRVFDTIPEQFDRWRTRYCREAFESIIACSRLDASKSALEIGPGTGQATEPILKTGCDYLAIELGAHLAAFTRDQFSCYPNFHIVNADFETYDFGNRTFDLVYSAATIQWIPEEIGFARAFRLLKDGGTFAMMMTRSDYRSPNEALYQRIQQVYTRYFHPETAYAQKMNYTNVIHYGFTDLVCREYQSRRVLSAEEYTAYIGTHSDHIVLREPDRSEFFTGVRNAILEAGDRIEIEDTVILYLARKPAHPRPEA